MFSSQLYSIAFLKTLITNSVEVVSKYAKSVGHCSKIVFSSLRTIDSPRYMKSAHWETSELRTYIHTTAKFCLLIFSYSNITLLQLLNNRHLQGEGIDPQSQSVFHCCECSDHGLHEGPVTCLLCHMTHPMTGGFCGLTILRGSLWRQNALKVKESLFLLAITQV